MVERGNCQVCSVVCESRCSFCRAVYYCSKEHQKKNWTEHKENCTRRKFKVDRNDKLGRFLVATEDIPADDILFKEKPLVLATKIGLLDTEDIICLGCFKLLSTSDSSDEEAEDNVGAESTFCLKCGLPVCSPKCSSTYFHKHFECILFKEAIKVKKAKLQQRQSQPQQENKTKQSGKNEGGEKKSSKASKSPDLNNPSTFFTTELKENFIQNLFFFRCLLLKDLNPELWTELMSLQSNNEFREDLGNLEKTTRIFEEMKNIITTIGHPTIDKISKPDLHKILGILDTNAVDIKISANMELSGIFPTFSMMEYSCIPSTKFYFTPPPVKSEERKSGSKHSTYELFVRSAVPLRTGDHLSFTITNILWNTQKRREEMKKTKYFWCECPRCIDPYELDSNFSSILCPLPACKSVSIPVPKLANSVVTVAGPGPSPGNRSSSPGTSNNDASSRSTSAATPPPSPTSPTGLMTPGVSTDREYQWQCSNKKCGKTCETWQVKKVDSKLAETIGQLSSKATINNYKDMLAQFEQVVHPDYYLNFVVNHSLIQMQGHDPVSRNCREVLEDKLTICNRLLGTIKKLDPGLAKLNIYTAVIYFEMHSAILAIAGGEGDEDYKILRKQPETVKLGRVYLQKCIDCFRYELLNSPETKLNILAKKKLEYLNMLLKHN